MRVAQATPRTRAFPGTKSILFHEFYWNIDGFSIPGKAALVKLPIDRLCGCYSTVVQKVAASTESFAALGTAVVQDPGPYFSAA